jgi:hypothetical protein
MCLLIDFQYFSILPAVFHVSNKSTQSIISYVKNEKFYQVHLFIQAYPFIRVLRVPHKHTYIQAAKQKFRCCFPNPVPAANWISLQCTVVEGGHFFFEIWSSNKLLLTSLEWSAEIYILKLLWLYHLVQSFMDVDNYSSLWNTVHCQSYLTKLRKWVYFNFWFIFEESKIQIESCDLNPSKTICGRKDQNSDLKKKKYCIYMMQTPFILKANHCGPSSVWMGFLNACSRKCIPLGELLHTLRLLQTTLTALLTVLCHVAQ